LYKAKFFASKNIQNIIYESIYVMNV